MLTFCITYFWVKGERRNCISPGEKYHTDSLENKYLINLCVKQNRNTHPRCTERSCTRLLAYGGRTVQMLSWSYLVQILERES